jgi:5'-3' exonuclease
MEQFIDVCILCGCDYTTNIAGIGPIKAFNYIDELSIMEFILLSWSIIIIIILKEKRYAIIKGRYY